LVEGDSDSNAVAEVVVAEKLSDNGGHGIGKGALAGGWPRVPPGTAANELRPEEVRILEVRIHAPAALRSRSRSVD